jgi:pilus assembly protein Flp/PilA
MKADMQDKLSGIFYSAIARMQLSREEGQGLVEYALILALVSIAVVGILTTLGGSIGTELSNVVNDL